MVEEQKAEAQQALEWLFSEHLLPFELYPHIGWSPSEVKNT
jgi:hypothetical protein